MDNPRHVFYTFTLAVCLTYPASGFMHDDRQYVVEFNPFLNKETASVFATSIRRKRQVSCTGVGLNCAVELSCECYKADCQREVDRERYCGGHCPSEQLCYLTVPCPAHFRRGCSDGIDVVFLLDGSLSQGTDWFKKQTDFVSNFISRSPVDFSYTRIAIMTYGFNSPVHFYLDSTYNKTELQERLVSLRATDGASRLDNALRTAREDVLTSAQGMRSNSYKYVVLLGDGLSSDHALSVEEASLLRQSGINVVAIGMGQQVWQPELLRLTGTYRNVFSSITDDAFNYVNYPYTYPRCTVCDLKSADVAYVMDSSDDVTIRDFFDQIDVMVTLTKETPIGPLDVRVSYTRYGADVHEEFTFDDYQTSDDAIVAMRTPIQRLQPVIGPSNTTKVLTHLRNQGFPTSTNTRKFLVLLSNGQFGSDFYNVIEAANELKNDGVFISVVGTGSGANITSLLQIASDPAYVYVIGEDVLTDVTCIYTLLSSFQYEDCTPNGCIW